MNKTYQEILDRILDKGVTLSFDNSDVCCPDCLQTIQSSAVPPASPLLTTHEVNDGNYRLYFLASVETAIKLMEFIGLLPTPSVPASPLSLPNPNSKTDCCLHYEASVETSLKLAEALDGDIPNNFKSCSTNFEDCINILLNSFTSVDTDRILDKGIVEYGSFSGQSKICVLKSFLDSAYDSQDKITLTRVEILDRILDKGIVVSCYDGEMSISSVETFIKWYEGYITGLAAVPA
jgi:hypothetical protein